VVLSVMFIAWIVLRTVMNPSLAPPFAHEDIPMWDRWRPLIVYVLPLVLIFVIVVAAMTAGWATPTEAAAIGAVATVAVAWVYRSLSWSNLMKALLGTAGISGIILFIIIGATTFAQILTFSGATNGMVDAIKEGGYQPWTVLIAMMAILLVLGCFIDQVSMMLICLPFFMPLVSLYGFDPVWFGVLFLICMQLGLLLPPHGLLLMTMRGVAPPQVTMAHIFQAVVPYVIMSLLLLALLLLFPMIATWLPNRLIG
jgi:tripartite ATP-independent transporter DctM subunit